MHEHHAYTDARPGVELAADLSDYYPGAGVQPSPNGAGGIASPATAKGKASVPAGGAPLHHHPALTVLALVAVSLVLLHHA